jgi:hypothetical protein
MYKHPNLFAELVPATSKLLAAPAMSFKLTMGIRRPSMPPPCGTRLVFKVVV